MAKLITLQNLSTFASELKLKYAKITDLTTLQEKVNQLVSAGGEPNKLEGVKVNGVAQTIADKMVDILIASGSANGTLSVAGADVAVAGLQALAFKAKVAQGDLEDALLAVINDKAAQGDLDAAVLRIAANEGKLATLIGSVEGDDAKSVRTISAEEVAKIVANAPEAYDTLKELADWLAGHETDAAGMNSAIQTNKTDIANLTALIGALPEGAASTTVVGYIAEAIAGIGIGDYAKTSEVTAAINTALANYYTKTEIDTKFAGYYTKGEVDTAVGAVDAKFAGYYTKGETDSAVQAVDNKFANYYTSTQVDTKLADYVLDTDIEAVTAAEITALLAD